MKETITLYSLNEKEYPNINKEFELIDNIRESLEYVTTPGKVIAEKQANVDARLVKEGEIVDTRPRVIVDGKLYTFSETKRIITKEEALAGAVIVTNPDGEEYVIKSTEAFIKKYKLLPNGKFQSRDGAKAFLKTNQDIIITASWGEKQYCPKDSALCIQNLEDIYSVTNSAFQSTYKKLEAENESF